MAYTPNTWVDRNVQYPRRYTDELGATKTFTPAPGTITQAGTSVNAAYMNNIEQGIVGVDGRLLTVENKYLDKTILNATGDIIYATANDTPAVLPIGSTGYNITSRGGVLTYEPPTVWRTIGSDTIQMSIAQEITRSYSSDHLYMYLATLKHPGSLRIKFEAYTTAVYNPTIVKVLQQQPLDNNFPLLNTQIGVTGNITNLTWQAFTVDTSTNTVWRDGGIKVYLYADCPTASANELHLRNVQICFTYTEIQNTVING